MRSSSRKAGQPENNGTPARQPGLRFSDYQERASDTNRLGSQGKDPTVVALLGLCGETGSLHTLYKKRFRDGDQFSGFRDKVKEELGDILWYLNALASSEDLSLSDIAIENLDKVHSRWLPTGDDDRVDFDEPFPPEQRLPRRFVAQFVCTNDDGVAKVEVFVDGSKCGSTLNDNAYVSDGYRFHDVFHMTCATFLGWSPVMRALLGRKRRNDPQTDMVEDGGRAIVTDEALAALVFNYAYRHKYLEEVKVLDWQILDQCHELAMPFEVGKRSRYEWEQTILGTFEIWRAIKANNGGWASFDADARTAVFSIEEPEVVNGNIA